MNFASHGTLSFTVEDNILFIHGTGPWNIETFLQKDSVADIKKPLLGNPWAVIMTIVGEPFHTPEAAYLLTDLVKQDKKQGRQMSALILDPDFSPELGKQHISQIYDDANETYQFFDNVVSAKRWIRAQLPKKN